MFTTNQTHSNSLVGAISSSSSQQTTSSSFMNGPSTPLQHFQLSQTLSAGPSSLFPLFNTTLYPPQPMISSQSSSLPWNSVNQFSSNPTPSNPLSIAPPRSSTELDQMALKSGMAAYFQLVNSSSFMNATNAPSASFPVSSSSPTVSPLPSNPFPSLPFSSTTSPFREPPSHSLYTDFISINSNTNGGSLSAPTSRAASLNSPAPPISPQISQTPSREAENPSEKIKRLQDRLDAQDQFIKNFSTQYNQLTKSENQLKLKLAISQNHINDLFKENQKLKDTHERLGHENDGLRIKIVALTNELTSRAESSLKKRKK